MGDNLEPVSQEEIGALYDILSELRRFPGETKGQASAKVGLALIEVLGRQRAFEVIKSAERMGAINSEKAGSLRAGIALASIMVSPAVEISEQARRIAQSLRESLTREFIIYPRSRFRKYPSHGKVRPKKSLGEEGSNQVVE